jgi:hypothetical protein
VLSAPRSARFPTANELVHDNYNFFVIGYSPTERPSDAIVSMAARANGLGLCFIHGAKLPGHALIRCRALRRARCSTEGVPSGSLQFRRLPGSVNTVRAGIFRKSADNSTRRCGVNDRFRAGSRVVGADAVARILRSAPVQCSNEFSFQRT